MSSIGMERHEEPVFWQEEDEANNPCFFWTNPYTGRKLYFPQLPVSERLAVGG
jgi:hypothetical protein